jgi:hypothetical protein
VTILFPHQCAIQVNDSSNQPTSDAELVVQFVHGLGARLGGNDRGSNYHSDKRQGNQEVMHSDVTSWGFTEPVHTWIIGVI